jgi:hypothetical protein
LLDDDRHSDTAPFMKTWVKWLAKLVLAAAILVLLAIRIDLDRVVGVLGAFDERLLVPIFASSTLIVYVSAYQTSRGLAPLGLRFSMSELFRIGLISGFYTLFLPGPLAGGGVSWYKLSRSQGQGIEVAALLIYFRVINILVLLSLGMIGVWCDPRLAASGLRGGIFVMFVGMIGLSLPLFSVHAANMLEHMAVSVGLHWPMMERLGNWATRGRPTLKALHSLGNVRE